MSTPYKLCPRCGQGAELSAPQCTNPQCGHQFRTQFVAPDATQLYVPPAAPPAAPAYGPPRGPPSYAPPAPQYAAGPDAMWAPAPSGPRKRPVLLLIGLTLLAISVPSLLFLLANPRAERASAPSGAAPVAPSRSEPAPAVATGGDSNAPAPAPVGSAPSLLSSQVFTEKQTTIEQPQIQVVDNSEAPQPPTLVLTGDAGKFTLEIKPPVVSMSVPAGAYRFALLGSGYRRSGRPDQEGVLICRQYRLYELELVSADETQRPQPTTLGDPETGVTSSPSPGR